MKRKVITTLLLLCLIAGICYYISLPDYHVRNSMSFSNQGTRDTELTVIVYKYWGRAAGKGEKNPELLFIDPQQD